MSASAKPRLGTRGNPEKSRAAILQAAMREFSREGVAGARTDAIARSARVNKALLYYYFKDKEALYAAVLDRVFGGLREQVDEAFAPPLPPRERLLSYAGAHFDYIASHPLYHRIVQGEMLHAGRGNSAQMERVCRQYFQPLFAHLAGLIAEGVRTGDFRPVDPFQFIPTMISVIVFYFTTAPVMRMMTGHDPLSPERLAERRAAVLDFLSAALFSPIREKRK
ncbi:MAG: TetR family transcriptional regulator [Acidobacteriales bacterium]|nr:TetR family transcriptional regulator [Terriglobales bacterium]